MPHTKWKNPSVLRLCPFDVPEALRSLSVKNSQPPATLAVGVGQFQRLQCLVVKHAGICQGHNHSLCQTHMGTEALRPLVHFHSPVPSQPEEEEEEEGWVSSSSAFALSCCSASSPGQTLLSQYPAGGGSSRTDISSLSEGQ